MEPDPTPAERLGRLLTDQGRTIAVVESLTGGGLSAAVCKPSGAGRFFTGGIVSYQRHVKHRLVGTPTYEVVNPETAQAMAENGRKLLGADLAVAVTGVAGPDPQDDQPVGTVFAGWADAGGSGTEHWELEGEPGEICAQTIERAILLALRVAGDGDGAAATGPGEGAE